MKARGGKELNKYLNGGKLSLKQMILAKCFECCGNYADGKDDCELSDCPLYPIMPYGVVWKGRKKGKIPVGFVKHRLQEQKGISIKESQNHLSQSPGTCNLCFGSPTGIGHGVGGND
jgi:hypothetical protein